MATGDALPETFKLEGISNYQSWKGRMRLLLLKGETWQYIDPAINNPPISGEPVDVAGAQVKALYSICMSCKEGPYSKIASCSEPRNAWNLLATTYQSANNTGQLMLKDRFHSLRLQEGGSIQEYLRQIEEIQQELCGINAEVPEPELVERIVNTLRPSYDYVYQNVLGLNALLSFANMIARLLQAETRAKFCASIDPATTRKQVLAVRIDNLNFRSSSHNSSYSNSNRKTFSPGYRKPGPCNFCADEEHQIR